MECTKVNCPMQVGTPTDNCSENCPWRTTAKTGDLISRAAAIAWFFRPYSNEESYSNLDVERALKAIPAVDAVPVVRCRDCKYYYSVNEECGCNGGYHSGDWYCANGERRNSE